MSKKEISYKQVGQNVIIVVNGQQYSKKMIEKSDRDSLKDNVISFNKKNTNTLEKKIIGIFTANAIAIKEKSAKLTKVSEKIQKATKAINISKSNSNSKIKTSSVRELTLSDMEKEKQLSPEEIERLSNILAKYKPTKAPTENKPTRRRGEY